MLYHLIEYLGKNHDIVGKSMFLSISFRTGVSLITSILFATVFGRKIINLLQKYQVGEVVRDLGLQGEADKKDTPTMGGVIIILSILLSTLLFTNLTNIYIILMLITTLAMGLIGFLDDYLKLKYKNKEGLKGKFKIIGQVFVGLTIGLTLWLSPNAVIRENLEHIGTTDRVENVVFDKENVKSTKTTIPFVKNNNLDYADIFQWAGEKAQQYGWILFIFVSVFIITAVSNSANLTDGVDGLATGLSAIIGVTLGIFAYVSGNVNHAGYLNIMYIPGSGELVIFAGAFIGATIGFLWYNAHPAQVFMGDTGSLTLGGIIASFSIIIHKELMVPIFCGIFFVESLSVIIQTLYFKITKKRYGTGRRVFLMSPIHHHFQKGGASGIKALITKPMRPIHESKLTVRFWLIGIILAAITIITLKVR